MKRTALRYGVIAGGIMFILALIPLLILRDKLHQSEYGEVLGYTSMVLGLLAVFFGIRHHRDHRSGGVISFGRAVGLGLMISVVASLIFVLVDSLYVTVIDPDFCTRYPEQQIARLQAQNAPPEKIQEVRDMAEMMKGTSGIIFLEALMFVTVFLIGLGITLFSALVLKRDAPAAA